MRRCSDSEKGSSLVEFALAGIPTIFLMITVIQLSLAMWAYHTLSFATRQAAQFASTKGPGCSYSGNSCAVANVARDIARAAAGLQPSAMNVSLTSTKGTVTCNPLSSCSSNTSVWPPQSIQEGSNISVSATYPVQVFCLPFQSTLMSSVVTLGASSRIALAF